MKPKIRKAEMRDREAIHAAHMRSIREVCIKDHGEEEVKGWGNRELGERWIAGIESGLVWVVEEESSVLGVASIVFEDDARSAHIQSLYLVPEAIGQGFGQRLMDLMMDEAKSRSVESISLDSTLTGHGFYRKFGFEDEGPARKRAIGGVPVTSIPMRKNLAQT